MKIVVPIIELLFAGLVITAAASFMIYSWLPDATRTTLYQDVLSPPVAIDNVSAIALLSAVSYGVGLISDFAGIWCFEGLLNNVKINRMHRYLIRNEGKLNKSRILAHLQRLTMVKIEKGWLRTSRRIDRIKKWLNKFKPYSTEEDSLLSALGNMRFHVLAKSPQVYAEIESQLWRLRFTRAVVFVQLLLITGALAYLADSVLIRCLLLIPASLVVILVNIPHIQHRHRNYCRAIERAYRVLVLDNDEGR
jgi:hypothetical protein